MNMTKNTYYVTTPIYYPTAKPHLGSAYTTIAADILARWNRLADKDVFFLTGTDDHGKKLQEAAEKAGLKPETFVDHIVPQFQEAWKKLNLHYDRFIRTTDSDHEQVVQTILSEMHKKGDIYEGYYEGLYCTACEAYYTEKDLTEGNCPIHKKPVEKIKEESYFFKLSKYQKKLLAHYKKNPDFISPEGRRQEVINRVKEGLQDLSISRTTFSWGVPLPFDKGHVAWVWFDALLNYISGIGYLEKQEMFNKFWPADVHLIGKDILWFHAVIWPAILMSAGIKLPKKIFAHGWLTIKGDKIGKSAGNAVDLDTLSAKIGVDSLRYVLFRETPFGQDGEFSQDVFIERHNNELANKLGNLVSRLSNLAEKYGMQKTKTELESRSMINKASKHIDGLEFDRALNEIFGFVDRINHFLQEKKPWETGDAKVIYQAANALKDVTILLYPFMPDTAEKIAKTFHFEISKESLNKDLGINKIKKAHILFKKIEITQNKMAFPPFKKQDEKKIEKVDSKLNENVGKSEEKSRSTINFDDFAKLDLRVGKITDVKEHPQADKLFVLTVNMGEARPRTIVAGLRNRYKKEELVGKKAVFVANLAPRMLKGVESNGMILAAAAEDDGQVIILSPERDIKEGSKIR
ncbi:MAG: methionine--tRNA ligase [Candidatus Liptonbacteria bacterium]|nr:methionine--tRNA ligase [Candidatus Pacearchaeota archaeon]MBM3256996.1 methionine--tRNA ligase [Candidatus Liptonbacteria bacterium]